MILRLLKVALRVENGGQVAVSRGQTGAGPKRASEGIDRRGWITAFGESRPQIHVYLRKVGVVAECQAQSGHRLVESTQVQVGHAERVENGGILGRRGRFERLR